MSGFEHHLARELEQLASEGLLRAPLELLPDSLVLCSNDYLGYATRPVDLAVGRGGAGASRLISGDLPEHRAAEVALAAWVGCEAAILCSSGYAANVGAIAALASADDVVVSDVLNHASIIDGCRLSRARVEVVPHRDLAAVERALCEARLARRRWIVTESYFSMDGDSPDLPGLRRLADAHDAALVVDEAHALGVFGPEGAGLCRQHGVTADVLIGTLGKALGLGGAFVAGSARLRAWLWNRARSVVFSTAPLPWLAEAAVLRVHEVRGDDQARTRLHQVSERARERLARAGAPIGPSFGPIIPWIVGEPDRAVEMRDALLSEGVFVQAIRPPTVPRETARLRITLHARLTDAELERALSSLCAVAARRGPGVRGVSAKPAR